jgi:hypothetical protein
MEVKQLILFVLVVFAAFSNAIKFDLETNKERCLKQAYRTDTLIKGSVSVAPPVSGMSLNIKVITLISKPTTDRSPQWTTCL